MPFVPAGYPDLAATSDVLAAAARGGASLIEVGFPFSDPVADGPVIQEAFTAALARGLKVADIFTVVGEARKTVALPMVAMVSYSIVFRFGIDRFIADAQRAGFDGLILPDLPPPEAEPICQKAWTGGLDTILLVAPQTTPARRDKILSLCTGFVYYLSVSGVTGERDRLPADLPANIAAIRSATDLPICVGFGLSKPEQVAQLKGVADGAIVGSALVRRMQQGMANSTSVGTAVEEYCRSLIQPAGLSR